MATLVGLAPMNARYLKALGVETKPNGYKPTTHSRTVWQSQR